MNPRDPSAGYTTRAAYAQSEAEGFGEEMHLCLSAAASVAHRMFDAAERGTWTIPAGMTCHDVAAFEARVKALRDDLGRLFDGFPVKEGLDGGRVAA